MSGDVTHRPVTLRISSTPDHLPVVRAATERLCRMLGFDEPDVTQVILSLDEALTNVIRHAYGGAEDQPIEIELSALGSPATDLRIRIRDHGRTADRRYIRSRPLDDLRPGGLGVHIMNECMDHLEYQHAEGGGTVLTMLKHLPARSGGSTR